MARTRDGPSDDEITEIWDLSRRVALTHGAHSSEADEVAAITTEKFIQKWNEDCVSGAREREGEGWQNFVAAGAANVQRDQIRSQRRRRARERSSTGASPGPQTPDRPGARKARPRDPSGVEQYLGRELIASEIKRLPRPRQRQCAQMVWLEGFTASEIASVLGLKPQTVRKHLRNANAILQRRIQRDDLY